MKNQKAFANYTSVMLCVRDDERKYILIDDDIFYIVTRDRGALIKTSIPLGDVTKALSKYMLVNSGKTNGTDKHKTRPRTSDRSK
jgi:hypothetical protein